MSVFRHSLAVASISLFLANGAVAQEIVSHKRSNCSDPTAMPLVPAAAANLPDRRVLTWSAARKNHYGGGGGHSYTSIFDPTTMTVTDRLVENTNHDMFCPGTAQVADRRIMIPGGTDYGNTTFYNPATNVWSTGPNMGINRGYHSMTPLSDGTVFTLGGSWSGGQGGKHGEIWTKGKGWRTLSGIKTKQMETADPQGVYRSDNHMWLFEAPDGRRSIKEDALDRHQRARVC